MRTYVWRGRAVGLMALVLSVTGCSAVLTALAQVKMLDRSQLSEGMQYVLAHTETFAQPVDSPLADVPAGTVIEEPLDDITGCWGSSETFSFESETPDEVVSFGGPTMINGEVDSWQYYRFDVDAGQYEFGHYSTGDPFRGKLDFYVGWVGRMEVLEGGRVRLYYEVGYANDPTTGELLEFDIVALDHEVSVQGFIITMGDDPTQFKAVATDQEGQFEASDRDEVIFTRFDCPGSSE